MKRHTLIFSLAVLAAAFFVRPGADALEISLEENKAERGNIGYVDMRKVFRLYPATHKAKQTYKEIVRQAEEQVNLRRGEVLALRSELSKLRLERELLEKSPVRQTPEPAPESAPEKKPAPVTQPETGKEPELSSATALSPAATSQIAAEEELDELIGAPGEKEADAPEKSAGADEVRINIPGLSEEPAEVAPPAGSAAEPAAPAKPAVPSLPAPRPGEDPLKMRERILKELDLKIAEKEKVLKAKEAEFSAYQSSVEKNLIEIESRRSEILLGKIYKAVRQVAQENGVSIVVDKNQIIYGQSTVDLTSKVLQRLKELPL